MMAFGSVRIDDLERSQASPWATPGMATPWTVALLSCWRWLRTTGTVSVVTVATVERNSAPSEVPM